MKITGDPDSPTSRGYLCPKGKASPELLYHPDRLTHPLRRVGERGENRWKRVSWDEALDEMTEKLTAIKRESGPEYFAMMQGTGRPYTGFTTRFANAFGTPNFTGVAHLDTIRTLRIVPFEPESQCLDSRLNPDLVRDAKVLKIPDLDKVVMQLQTLLSLVRLIGR